FRDTRHRAGAGGCSRNHEEGFGGDKGGREMTGVAGRAVQKIFAASFALAALLTATQAAGQDVAAFFKGKRINLIVGSGTGGGSDVYARVLARHMSKYVPGNPNIVIQNMPGAGSLRGANYIYNVAPKDGTVFGTFGRNIALLGLIKSNQNVQFNPAKFTW